VIPAEEWAETVRIESSISRVNLIKIIEQIQTDAMHSPFTNRGSNQDADDFHAQKCDRERAAAESAAMMFAEIADNNRRNLRLCQKSNMEEAARRDTERAGEMIKPMQRETKDEF
jgi:hypothetical protein